MKLIAKDVSADGTDPRILIRTRHIVICLLLLTATVSTNWATQSPPINVQRVGNKLNSTSATSQHLPPAEQRGTEQSPLFVKTLPSSDNEVVARRNAEDRENKAATDGWTVFLAKVTAIILALQLIVFAIQTRAFFVQARRLRETIVEMEVATSATKQTAAAAKESTESYKVAERAWVSFSKVYIQQYSNATNTATGQTNLSGTMFNIQWTNAGRTPAVKCNLFSVGRVTAGSADVPTFSPPAAIPQRQAPLIPGVEVGSPPCHFYESDIKMLESGERRIFIYGRIDYEDIFMKDLPRHTEVCMEIGFGGFAHATDGKKTMQYVFTAMGPQNSAD